jgi:hypothetical protein
VPCTQAVECNDDNECTEDVCDAGGFCENTALPAATACGDATVNECTAADTCNGAGVCLPNHTAAAIPCGDTTVNECTAADTCDGAGACLANHAAAAAPCGSATADECTAADTCDGAGVCLPNNVDPGTSCTIGSCNELGACDCASERITTVPFGGGFETSPADGDVYHSGTVDCSPACTEIPDHVAVFVAPSTGTFRFTVSATADARIAILEGDCETLGTELACNDDIDFPSNLDAEVDLPMTAGDVVTVIVTDGCEAVGGDGTLSISEVL